MGSRVVVKEMKYHSWMNPQRIDTHKIHQAKNVGKKITSFLFFAFVFYLITTLEQPCRVSDTSV